MYWRKSDTAKTYINRKLDKGNKYTQSNITQLKQQAIDHFNRMSIPERLNCAEFGDIRQGQTDQLGNLYYGIVNIWINRSGNIFKNKPKGGL